MRALPLGLARSLGSGLGRAFYRLVPYERKKTQRSLSQAFPDKDAAWVDETAAQVFSGLGRSAIEFFRMADFRPQDLDQWVASVEGFEHVSGPIQRGQGVVAVTAHLAHWELLAAWVAARHPVSVVARQAFNPSLDAALTARRERLGVHVFGRNTAVRPILKWLKEGKVLGVLADQDTGVDSLYVECFGRLAKTPSGPAFLAQATGAALVTGFCFREPDGRYRFRFGPAIPVPERDGSGPMQLWDAVQAYTRRTEEAIREQPSAWAWNHARWRSPIDQASTGWDPRLAGACRERLR